MPSQKVVTQLVSILIRKTVDKEIEWTDSTTPRNISNGTDDLIDGFFRTRYKEQDIGVYERRYRDYDADNDVHYWTGRPKIAILEGDSSLWEGGEGIPLIADLLKVARESASGIDDIFKNLIK